MIEMVEFIECKRDGGQHAKDDLREFVMGVRDALIPDYQSAAWLMAVYFNGLDRDELAAFTEALATSGDVAKLPDDRVAVDKHSTGGVGDKTTLIVAPLVASCGLSVAKLSGRGLGFTGGTVDKLESIPGMNVHLSTEQFLGQLERIGIAISGHSLALAPAEGKFYALRDVTGTVPSIPLIASSIVSKKIAGGADAFVFDVKCGSGAFMANYDEAEALAAALVDLSASLGKKSVCLITDMEQPLGEWVGNAVEVYEAVQVLSGAGPLDTRDICVALASEMLMAGGLFSDEKKACARALAGLDDGSALAKFAETIEVQGGNSAVCSTPETLLPRAARRTDIYSPTGGFVAKMDARNIGCAVRALGGGRLRKEDDVDLSVGIRVCAKTGQSVVKGEALMEVYYNHDDQFEAAARYLKDSFEVSDECQERTLILGRVE